MKSLINFNVPRAGRITSDRLIGAAVVGGLIIAAWNWSEQIPYIGKQVRLGKYYVSYALGFTGLAKPIS